jgi:copper transport protein
LRGILGQGLGWQDLGLLIGLSLCVASVMVRHRVTAQALAFYGALITTASFVLWGHALESTRTWLTVPADITHVVAAAVWLGGLVGVAVVLRSRIGHLELDAVAATPGRGAPIGEAGEISVATVGSGQIEHGGTAGGTALLVADPPSDERANLRSTVAIVSRFSTVAAASLILLSVAGVALGWTETGSIAGLTTTTYGRLLLAKVAVVLVIAFIAGYNRFFLLPWLFQDTDDVEGAATAALVASPTDAIPVGSIEPPRPVEPMDLADGVEPAEVDDPDELRAGWRSLLNTVRFEAVLIVVVLALTAVLTNTPPGTTSVDTEIFQEAQPFRGGQVTLTITPNTVGPNAFHVDMVDADHHGADLGTRVTVELTMPANNIGPITREMLKAGTGHFILDDVDDLAVAGTWQIVLVIRVSDFEQERLTFQDDVR